MCIPLEVSWSGPSAIQITLAEEPQEQTFDLITSCVQTVRESMPSRAVIDVVPAYTTVTVIFDPAALSREEAWQRMSCLRINTETKPDAPPVTHALPVCFCRACGLDQDFAVSHSGLAWEVFIQRYAGTAYRIEFIGFQPGFPFMRLKDPKLALPRLAEPRLKVPAGSVGIGGAQTGFYPMSTPGGWRIIGRTRQTVCDPAAGQLPPYKRGDIIRFSPVSHDPD